MSASGWQTSNMEEAEDELARLRAENARLRAMIDHLERAGGNEPVPLAANTQIIKREEAEEAPAPTTAIHLERQPKSRRRRNRKQKEQEESPFRGCLAFLLIFGGSIAAYTGLLILSIILSNELQVVNFWGWLFVSLLGGPIILFFIVLMIGGIQSLRARRHTPISPPKKPRERPRRRITRKLRAATTQKLDAE